MRKISLLSDVAHGRLAEGVPIPNQAAQDHLTIACLELMHLAPRLDKTLLQADMWYNRVCKEAAVLRGTSRLTSLRACMQSMSSYAGEQDNPPEWMVSLGNALRHLRLAADQFDTISEHHAAQILEALLARIWETVLEFVFPARSSQQFRAVIVKASDDLDRHVQRFLEYGLYPASALQFAAAGAFSRSAGALGPPSANTLAEEAFRLWNEADNLAAAIRPAKRYTDVLTAALECHFRYGEAAILLDWAIRQCEKAGKDAGELHTESQVVEELRVVTAETLRFLGTDFLLGTQIVTRIVGAALYGTAPVDPAVVTADSLPIDIGQTIDDAAAANPLFPDEISRLWRAAIAQIVATQPDRYLIQTWDELTELLRQQVPNCFDDPNIVRKALLIGERELADLMRDSGSAGQQRPGARGDFTPVRKWLGRMFRRNRL